MLWLVKDDEDEDDDGDDDDEVTPDCADDLLGTLMGFGIITEVVLGELFTVTLDDNELVYKFAWKKMKT